MNQLNMGTTTAQPLVLRDYQLQVKGGIYDSIRQGQRRILVVAGTGAGKTEVGTSIAMDALSRGKRVTFLVDRNNLVHQTARRFEKYGLNPAKLAGGDTYASDNPCQVVSIQTLTRRRALVEELTSGVVFFDEAHKTAFTTLGKEVLTSDRDNILVGLTATPWRLSKHEAMGTYFDHLVLSPLMGELQQMGHLVKARYFGLSGIDLETVGTQAGDYSVGDMDKVLTNDPTIVTRAVDEWQRLAAGRPTIAFTVNVAHALAVADEFNSRGIPAKAVHGQMPTAERELIYQQLESGELLVLTSCEALAEGFDVPKVSCVMQLRPTKSKAKHVQQIGRSLRLFSGKTDAIIIDQAANCRRHGFPEDYTKEDFALKLPSEKGEPGEALVKPCPVCGALVHIAKMICPECGYEFPAPPKVSQKSQLVELRRGTVETQNMAEDQLQYRIWKKEAYKKSMAPGAASAKYNSAHGKWPSTRSGDWDFGAVFDGNPSDRNAVRFWNYLVKIYNRKLDSHKPWTEKNMVTEFDKEFGSGAFEVFRGKGVI